MPPARVELTHRGRADVLRVTASSRDQSAAAGHLAYYDRHLVATLEVRPRDGLLLGGALSATIERWDCMRGDPHPTTAPDARQEIVARLGVACTR